MIDDRQRLRREACPRCGKPEASAEDWDTIPEGKGEHLCWELGGPSCPEVDWREKFLEAEARVRELEEARELMSSIIAAIAIKGAEVTESDWLLALRLTGRDSMPYVVARPVSTVPWRPEYAILDAAEQEEGT